MCSSRSSGFFSIFLMMSAGPMRVSPRFLPVMNSSIWSFTFFSTVSFSSDAVRSRESSSMPEKFVLMFFIVSSISFASSSGFSFASIMMIVFFLRSRSMSLIPSSFSFSYG